MARGGSSAQKKADEWYDAGIALLEEARFEASIPYFSKAIFLYPEKDMNFYFQRAEAYFALCDYTSAISNYRKACSLPDADGTARDAFVRALDAKAMSIFRRSGSLQSSIAHLSEALELDGLFWRGFLHRALLFVKTAEWQSALDDLNRAIFLKKTHSADVFVLRAKVHWMLGNEESGNADMKRASRVDHRHPEVVAFNKTLAERADAVCKSATEKILAGDLDGAVRELSRAVELNANNINLLVLLSSTCRKLGRYKDALGHLQEASEIYREEMKWRQSEGKAAEASDDDPKVARQRTLVWNAMAVAAVRQSDPGRAVDLLTKAINAEESMQGDTLFGVRDRRFYINRGDAYRSLGKLNESLVDYMSAHRLKSDDWETKSRISVIKNAFGIQAFNEQSYEEAVSHFNAAVRFNPKVAEYYMNRGDAYSALGLGREAYDDYRKASHKGDKNNFEVAARLARFEI